MTSFIIPAKNEASYIAECLRSIMAQDAPESLEIIVVDNNSTDNTAGVVVRNFPQVIMIAEKNSGTSAARQRGAMEAGGEILIFLDADVRLPDKEWLKRALQKIGRPQVVAVSSHYRYYGLGWHLKLLQTFGTFVFVYPWIFLVNNLLRVGAHMVGGLMIIKRAALVEARGFDINSKFFGDEALITRRLYRLGEIVVSPQLWVLTSGRRFKKQGLVLPVFNYVLNYFWVLLTGHPYNKGEYREIR